MVKVIKYQTDCTGCDRFCPFFTELTTVLSHAGRFIACRNQSTTTFFIGWTFPSESTILDCLSDHFMTRQQISSWISTSHCSSQTSVSYSKPSAVTLLLKATLSYDPSIKPTPLKLQISTLKADSSSTCSPQAICLSFILLLNAFTRCNAIIPKVLKDFIALRNCFGSYCPYLSRQYIMQ